MVFVFAASSKRAVHRVRDLPELPREGRELLGEKRLLAVADELLVKAGIDPERAFPDDDAFHDMELAIAKAEGRV